MAGSRTVCIRLSKELYDVLKKAAEEEGMTLSNYVRRLIKKAMEAEESGPPRSPELLDLIARVDFLTRRLSELEEKVLDLENALMTSRGRPVHNRGKGSGVY